MNRYAIILDNKVINVIIWNGEDKIAYSKQPYEIIANSDNYYKIGMYKENGIWKEPVVEMQVEQAEMEQDV